VRRALLGACAIGLYLLAVTTTHVPVRPLYDGTGPPLPYNWVKPPSGFKNKKPRAFSQNVDIGKKGSVGANLATDDGQAVLILPEGSFAEHGGDTSIRFRFVPLDPAKVTPPPTGPSPQGNAYAVTAKYLPSGTEAAPAQPITVLLRYPSQATTILRLDGSTWRPLKAQNLASTLQIYANTPKLGTFVAAGGHNNSLILWYITGGVSAIAAILGLFLGLRERRARPARRRN
jgi:hypothetical protein